MSARVAPKILLPGTWLRVDLTSEATTRSSIRRLIEAGVGRSDSLARLRAHLRTELQAGADIARKGQAVEFYVAQSIAPGVPLAATLSVHVPEVDQDKLRSLGLDELAELFESAERTGHADSTSESAVEEIRVVRAVSHGFANSSGESEPVPLVSFDYWMAATNPPRIALLAFSSSFVQFEDQLTELFDAVVAATRWRVEETV
jgi:hypothetical protein